MPPKTHQCNNEQTLKIFKDGPKNCQTRLTCNYLLTVSKKNMTGPDQPY